MAIWPRHFHWILQSVRLNFVKCAFLSGLASVLTLAGPGQAAFAATSSVTTLAVTAGGAPVTSVESLTVVTLTATVTAGGNPVGKGMVNFCSASLPSCIASDAVGTATLIGGVATLRFRPGTGTFNYIADFQGNGVDAASASSSVTLTVTPATTGPAAPTTTALSSTGSPGNYTLTATVTSNGNVAPAGNVNFVDLTNGNTVLASPALTSPGGTYGFLTINGATDYQSGYPLATGDFNGDGIPDLIVEINQGTPPNATVLVTVQFGNGGGTFKTVSSLPISGPVLSNVVVGDFNGDGKQDLAFQSTDPSNTGYAIVVMVGDGAGNFTKAASTIIPFPSAYASIAMTAGDINGDGILDLVMEGASQANGYLPIMLSFLGVGDGTFAQAGSVDYTSGDKDYSVTLTAPVAGDFNGDGNLDFAIGYKKSLRGGLLTVPALSVLSGDGQGNFSADVSYAALGPQLYGGYFPSDSTASLAAGDLDGDGLTDLAMVFSSAGAINAPASSGLLTYLQNFHAAGLFLEPTNLGVPASVAIGNFHDDGTPTEAVLWTGGYVTLGTDLTLYTFPPPPIYSSNVLLVADFDGDGYTDLAFNYGLEPRIFGHLAMATASASGVAVLPLGSGAHQVQAGYAGDTQHASSTSSPVTLIAADAIPALQISASANPANYGMPVTITATLTGAGATASGTVVFSNNGVAVGTATLTADIATTVLSNLAAGTYTITASYSGDSNNKAVTSAPFTLTVNKQTPSLSLSTHTPLISYGDGLTLTARITVQGSIPTGSLVTFQAGSVTLGTAPMDGNGIATLALASTALPVGYDPVTASFAGSANFLGATSSPLTITVVRATSTLTLTPSATTITYGSTETLTATITGGGAEHNGTVTFKYGNITLGTSDLNNSVATFATNALPGGMDSLTAAWTGDANHNAATASPIAVQVAPLLVLAASQPTLYAGVAESVQIKLNVGSNSVTPTGTITLSGVNYTSAAIALVSGAATVPIPANTLPAGNVTLTAAYSGDPAYTACSAKLTIVVSTGAPPGFTLAASSLSVTAGATTNNTSTVTLTPIIGFTGNVALTASVTSSPAGAVHPPVVSFGANSTIAVSGTGASTATLTVTTTAPTTSSSNERPSHTQWPGERAFGAGGAVLACLMLLGLPGPRGGRLLRSASVKVFGLGLLLISLGMTVTGCGGSSNSGGPSPHTTPGTTPGNYTITVTGTSGSVTESGTLTLTVQ